MALLEDAWLVGAIIGVVCLLLDVLLRAERNEVLREFLAGVPLIFIPVACALLIEGRSNRPYLILGVLFLLIQFVLLQAFHRYGRDHQNIGKALGALSALFFFMLWSWKPSDPHIVIVSPKKVVHAPQKWASVVVSVSPSLASDEILQVFVHSGDLKWWPCEKAHKDETSHFVSKCPFGDDHTRSGDQFRISALYGKAPIGQWLSEPAWDAMKAPSEVEDVTFMDGK
jgi:hypothetical protein